MSGRTSFDVLEAEGAQRQQWVQLLDGTAGVQEVFAHPEYLRLYCSAGQRPMCAVYREAECQAIYPFILRDLRTCPFWGMARDELYDTISAPYGYGGPFIQGTQDASSLLIRFFRAYEQWAVSQRVVSEYISFSPKESRHPIYPGDISSKLPSVLVKVDIPSEQIWSGYRESVRKCIKTAERSGVLIEVDEAGIRSDAFLQIYMDTMQRRDAPPSYHMNGEFLDRLRSTLKGYFAYFHAWWQGKIVSSELVLVSHDSTFSFRGGTLKGAFPIRPNHLLKHSIILWSQRTGKRFYILGGGNGGEDSIYRYKLSFSPSGSRYLKVGKWILNHTQYGELVSARRAHENSRGANWEPSPTYFPTYRSPSSLD